MAKKTNAKKQSTSSAQKKGNFKIDFKNLYLKEKIEQLKEQADKSWQKAKGKLPLLEKFQEVAQLDTVVSLATEKSEWLVDNLKDYSSRLKQVDLNQAKDFVEQAKAKLDQTINKVVDIDEVVAQAKLKAKNQKTKVFDFFRIATGEDLSRVQLKIKRLEKKIKTIQKGPGSKKAA